MSMPECKHHVPLDSVCAQCADRPVVLACLVCNAPRTGESCHKCGGELTVPHSSWTWPAVPDIEPIRKLAHEVGYALAVHGSLERDLDLIAAPWTDEAVSAKDLIFHIVDGLSAIVVGPIEQKPMGRIAASIKIQGWFKMIDLSVCPRAVAPVVPKEIRQVLAEVEAAPHNKHQAVLR